MEEWNNDMYETYKKFILSDELYEAISWVKPLIDDDLEGFVRLFEQDKTEDLMFDPIEFAAAYDAEEIFGYLIQTYDYNNFKNAVDFSLLIVLMLFEREHLLMTVLEVLDFDDEHRMEMYAYMIEHNDMEYFMQFFDDYPVHYHYFRDLLRLSLNNYSIFHYLIELDGFDQLRFDERLAYDILSFHPELLYILEGSTDIEGLWDTDVFANALAFEQESDFEKVLDFLLERGWDLNEHNGFGLNSFHQALRHAKKPRYVERLIEKGADPTTYTTEGYAPAHQLLLRSGTFTVQVREHIDLAAEDRHGLKLEDYDRLMRNSKPSEEELASVVALAMNMSREQVYELSEADFFDLAAMFDIELFSPYMTLLTLPKAEDADMIEQELMQANIEISDIHPILEMFPDSFDYHPSFTLQLGFDLLDLDAYKPLFSELAERYNTTLTVETEGHSMNKTAHIQCTFKENGQLTKEATVYSNLIDVFYIHRYYFIPLASIAYEPVGFTDQRYLN